MEKDNQTETLRALYNQQLQIKSKQSNIKKEVLEVKAMMQKSFMTVNKVLAFLVITQSIALILLLIVLFTKS